MFMVQMVLDIQMLVQIKPWLILELIFLLKVQEINAHREIGHQFTGLDLLKTVELLLIHEEREMDNQNCSHQVKLKYSNAGILPFLNSIKVIKLTSLAQLIMSGEMPILKPHLVENQSLFNLILISKSKQLIAIEFQNLQNNHHSQ